MRPGKTVNEEEMPLSLMEMFPSPLTGRMANVLLDWTDRLAIDLN